MIMAYRKNQSRTLTFKTVMLHLAKFITLLLHGIIVYREN